jgi:hypothetical protein
MNTSLDIPSANDDAWTLAEGLRDGFPSVLRFRPGLKAFLGDARYSRRLRVTWTYPEDNESGMPSSDESNAMRPLEDQLVSAFEAANAGVLAFVFTHRGTREWHFYVDEAADLSALINEALAELPGLPIAFELEDDPDWVVMSNVLESVRETH